MSKGVHSAVSISLFLVIIVIIIRTPLTSRDLAGDALQSRVRHGPSCVIGEEQANGTNRCLALQGRNVGCRFLVKHF